MSQLVGDMIYLGDWMKGKVSFTGHPFACLFGLHAILVQDLFSVWVNETALSQLLHSLVFGALVLAADTQPWCYRLQVLEGRVRRELCSHHFFPAEDLLLGETPADQTPLSVPCFYQTHVWRYAVSGRRGKEEKTRAYITQSNRWRLMSDKWKKLTAFLCPDLNAREHSGGRICNTVSLITSAHDSCSSFLSGRTRQYTWGRGEKRVCVCGECEVGGCGGETVKCFIAF